MSHSTVADQKKSDVRKSERTSALITYGLVVGLFLTVCTLAVVATMAQEKSKTGFKAIRVKQPISFIDKTYYEEDASATPDSSTSAP
ncbi:MAG: hypothetical protein SFZ03_11280 [Candidatus Melainabacteria bacterium]|nr:hypothetical protein [Candidatus Melainabacteria bacterium]